MIDMLPFDLCDHIIHCILYVMYLLIVIIGLRLSVSLQSEKSKNFRKITYQGPSFLVLKSVCRSDSQIFNPCVSDNNLLTYSNQNGSSVLKALPSSCFCRRKTKKIQKNSKQTNTQTDNKNKQTKDVYKQRNRLSGHKDNKRNT